MRATATCLLVLCAGCVDGFQGSNLELDFAPGTPVLASAGATPGPGELPTNTHFTLYAYQTSPEMTTGSLFSITDFEIRRVVDLLSPCFIDVGDHVPHPGLHVSQYATVIGQDVGIPDVANPPPGATEEQKTLAATAVQREQDIQLLVGPTGIRAVTSATGSEYPPMASNCTDTIDIPPPECIDEASNARRLAQCQAAWAADPNHYEGTDRVLTSPLNGVSHGMVDGENPINLAPVGGAGFFVEANLVGFDGYAVYTQTDGVASPGELLLFGTPTMVTRGVTHVHLASPGDGLYTAELAIFSNLGDDNEQF